MEVGWNEVVVHRELVALGFTGTYQQVQRYLKPLGAKRRWSQLATVRFETAPGEQAQVDYGQRRVWIGEQPQTVHLFVRFHAGVFAPPIRTRVPQRKTRHAARRARELFERWHVIQANLVAVVGLGRPAQKLRFSATGRLLVSGNRVQCHHIIECKSSVLPETYSELTATTTTHS